MILPLAVFAVTVQQAAIAGKGEDAAGLQDHQLLLLLVPGAGHLFRKVPQAVGLTVNQAVIARFADNCVNMISVGFGDEQGVVGNAELALGVIDISAADSVRVDAVTGYQDARNGDDAYNCSSHDLVFLRC